MPDIIRRVRGTKWWAELDWHPNTARRRLLERDRGVCAACGKDCLRLRAVLDRLLSRARLRSEHPLFDDPRYVAVLAARIRVPLWRFSGALWDCDHVVPLRRGGRDELGNMQTLCVPCHANKTARESRGIYDDPRQMLLPFEDDEVRGRRPRVGI